jgi:cytochrome c5
MISEAHKSRVFAGALALLVFPLLLASPGRAADFPDGPGKDVLLKTCNVCHGTKDAF